MLFHLEVWIHADTVGLVNTIIEADTLEDAVAKLASDPQVVAKARYPR